MSVGSTTKCATVNPPAEGRHVVAEAVEAALACLELAGTASKATVGERVMPPDVLSR